MFLYLVLAQWVENNKTRSKGERITLGSIDMILFNVFLRQWTTEYGYVTDSNQSPCSDWQNSVQQSLNLWTDSMLSFDIYIILNFQLVY